MLKNLLVAAVVVGPLATSCSQDSSIASLNSAEEEYELVVGEAIATPDDVMEKIQAMEAAQAYERSHSQIDEDIAGSIIIAQNIINLGKEVWTVIQAGKAVSDIKTDYATGLPEGIKNWTELQGFSNLIHKTYPLEGKNSRGKVKNFGTFTLVHQYGGNLDGKGKYLTTVGVIGSNITTGWNQSLNFTSNVVNVANAGTKDSPIASVTMEMKLSRSGLTKYNKAVLFQFRGDSENVIMTEQ